MFKNPIFLKKEDIKDNIPYFNVYLFSLLLNVFVIVGILLLGNRIPPEIPLYYGLAEGKSQLASTNELIIPSVISLSVLLLNLVLVYAVKDDFLKKVLIMSAFAVTLFSTITTVKIILLVGSF